MSLYIELSKSSAQISPIFEFIDYLFSWLVCLTTNAHVIVSRWQMARKSLHNDKAWRQQRKHHEAGVAGACEGLGGSAHQRSLAVTDMRPR